MPLRSAEAIKWTALNPTSERPPPLNPTLRPPAGTPSLTASPPRALRLQSLQRTRCHGENERLYRTLHPRSSASLQSESHNSPCFLLFNEGAPLVKSLNEIKEAANAAMVTGPLLRPILQQACRDRTLRLGARSPPPWIGTILLTDDLFRLVGGKRSWNHADAFTRLSEMRCSFGAE